MEFRDLNDAKALMGEAADLLGPEERYYDDFRFFRAINCTTQAEYREELKHFLESFRGERTLLPPAIQTLYPRLMALYDWL